MLPPDLMRLTAGCMDMRLAVEAIYALAGARPADAPGKGEAAPEGACQCAASTSRT